MNYTDNYQFNLPSLNDSADISALNENFSAIDEKLKENADAIGNVQVPTDQTYKPTSANPQSGKAVAEALANIEIDVDDEMSDTSENPVQNKAIKQYVDDALGNIKIDNVNYRVITEITLTEDVNQISVTKDDNGKNIKLKEVFVLFRGKFAQSTTNVRLQLRIYDVGSFLQLDYGLPVTAGNYYGYWVHSKREWSNFATPTTDRISMWRSEYPKTALTNFVESTGFGEGTFNNNADLRSDVSFINGKRDSATQVVFGFPSSGNQMSAGSKILVLGVDA